MAITVKINDDLKNKLEQLASVRKYSIHWIIAEMIEPYRGKIYDPCCGSGGMFVQSMKFVENHDGNKKDFSVYGQEYTTTTYKLAKGEPGYPWYFCQPW